MQGMLETAAHRGKLAYGPEEVQGVTGVGRTTVYSEIASGRLKARKVGRRTVILHEDLVDWLNRLPERAAAVG